MELLFLHLPDGDFATLGFHTQYVLDGTPSSSSTSDDKDTPGPLQIKKIGYSGDDDNGLSCGDNNLDTSRFFSNMK